MIREDKYCFGTVDEIAEEIWANLKTGEFSRWDVGGSTMCLYWSDADVMLDFNNGKGVDEIVTNFAGWSGMKVLEENPFDSADTILIGDNYGGGAFDTCVLPDGIHNCEEYKTKTEWVKMIALMICSIMELQNGWGKPDTNCYIVMEKID